ncbi:GntR family transcriptional regulator [Rhodococcus erythropolis]|uniref:GntR family transcriptional regulator n=1 Tax=Rhodococcus TaxID=1827 RepID=UPI001F479570|nr:MULTISPECIES: GntR family transcriptional regulator [unclassified Rhodococcus (in: high G+C Gram-positive bacteria)]
MSTGMNTAPEPLREVVYRELRTELVNGTIGFDQRLTEPKLSTRFGISRTPIREALTMLCADGLLRREEYGFSAVRPSIPLIRDLYELRITLELQGITRAIADPTIRHDRTILDDELVRWRALALDPPAQEPGFVERDEEFHVAVLRASGNNELVASLLSVNSRIRHVRMYDFMVNGRIDTSIAEHIRILEELRAGNLPEARTLLHQHIGESLDVVLDRVTRAITALSLANITD